MQSAAITGAGLPFRPPTATGQALPAKTEPQDVHYGSTAAETTLQKLTRQTVGTLLGGTLSLAGKVTQGLSEVSQAIHPPSDAPLTTPFPKPLTTKEGPMATVEKIVGGPLYPLAKTLAGIPFTRFDTPAVRSERQRQLSLIRDHVELGQPLNSAGISTPSRQALRQELIDQIYGQGAQVKGRQAWVLIGVPACGKSTLEEPLAKDNGALVVDGDDIRDLLPESRFQKDDFYVNAEKEFIHDSVLARSAEAGDNVVISYAMNSSATIQRALQEFKDHGYQTHLFFLHVPVDKAIQRSIGRFEATGRLVDPIAEVVNPNGPERVYDQLKNSRWVDSYARYSTDVPKGTMPTLEEEGQN